jgi:hypothetical protein
MVSGPIIPQLTGFHSTSPTSSSSWVMLLQYRRMVLTTAPTMVNVIIASYTITERANS